MLKNIRSIYPVRTVENGFAIQVLHDREGVLAIPLTRRQVIDVIEQGAIYIRETEDGR